MDCNKIHKIFFLGIGGIGMSALARYFHALGKNVSGYDRTPSALTEQLQQEGIAITFDDKLENYPIDADLIIYTPAIPVGHIGFNFYKNNNYNLQKRAAVLGLISENKKTICVAGSHGKTTVSSMIAHILIHAGFDVTAFLGGIATNYNSNYIRQKIVVPEKNHTEWVVIEADEFDRSFHHLKPTLAVVTAVDTDHLDIYGTKEKIDEAFIRFVKNMDEEGFLVIRQGESINDHLPLLDKAFYALHDTTADVYCPKYWQVDGGYVFTVSYFGQQYIGMRLGIGGFHNIENALSAFTIAKELNIPTNKIKEGLATFKGIKRRFEVVVKSEHAIYIDDYAHHPEEIRVFLASVKEFYPDKKLTAIFQPHLFSRTRDLAEGFAQSLSIADAVWLLDIYPARELPIDGVTSDLIFNRLTASEKKKVTKEEVLTLLCHTSTEILVTIGAGDIDKLVQPIRELLMRKTNQ